MSELSAVFRPTSRACDRCDAPPDEVSGARSRERGALGATIGEGGNKIVFVFGSGAMGVLKSGKRALIADEIQMLADLKMLGLPVTKVDGPMHVDGFAPASLLQAGRRCRPAIEHAERYAVDSKQVVRVHRGKVSIQGTSPALGAASVASLQAIRRQLVDGRIFVNDLQFLVRSNGEFLIADPLDVKERQKPSQTNLRIIDSLIELARKAARP